MQRFFSIRAFMHFLCRTASYSTFLEIINPIIL
jgi:hypothetical protein